MAPATAIIRIHWDCTKTAGRLGHLSILAYRHTFPIYQLLTSDNKYSVIIYHANVQQNKTIWARKSSRVNDPTAPLLSTTPLVQFFLCIDTLHIYPNNLLLNTLINSQNAFYPSFILCNTSLLNTLSAATCDPWYLKPIYFLELFSIQSHMHSTHIYIPRHLTTSNLLTFTLNFRIFDQISHQSIQLLP